MDGGHAVGDTDKLRQRMAAPDWDMWLGLGATLLEQLADARDARRKRAAVTPPAPAVPAPRGPAPAPAPVPGRSVAVVEARSLTLAANPAGRRMSRAAGVLAASVLAEGALNAVRGERPTPAGYAPLAVSALSLVASLHGAVDRRRAGSAGRTATYAAAALTGLAGRAFHDWRAGGILSWQGLLQRAETVPTALTLSGLVGLLAERVRSNRAGVAPRVFGLPAGRVVGLATAGGLMGTVGDAPAKLRGALHDPSVMVPVALPPVAAGALGIAALGAARVRRPVARWLLRAAALAGLAPSAIGISALRRAPGGWRNWRRNIADGPIVPAPPAFAGLALAGLAALDLMEEGGPPPLRRRRRARRVVTAG